MCIFFLLNSTRILWYFWDVGLILFGIFRCSFCINFGFEQFSWFSIGKLGTKIDQNCKLWVHFIWAKIQNFEGFFKRCVSLTGRLPLFKISAKSNNICGIKGSTPYPYPPFLLSKKGAISWTLNQYEKLRKILTSQPQMLLWRNLSQIYIWIKSFIWQNLGA